jgi:hypothetical protein
MCDNIKPICDNAENLAGAGTDVRRCSDALGPRKNLHGRASQVWADILYMGMYLISRALRRGARKSVRVRKPKNAQLEYINC